MHFLRRWPTTFWSISSFLSSSVCGNNCFHVKFDLSFALLQEYPWGVIIHSLNAQMWISVFSFLNNLRSFLGIWYGYSLLSNNWRQFYGIVIDVSMEILSTICCIEIRCEINQLYRNYQRKHIVLDILLQYYVITYCVLWYLGKALGDKFMMIHLII